MASLPIVGKISRGDVAMEHEPRPFALAFVLGEDEWDGRVDAVTKERAILVAMHELLDVVDERSPGIAEVAVFDGDERLGVWVYDGELMTPNWVAAD